MIHSLVDDVMLLLPSVNYQLVYLMFYESQILGVRDYSKRNSLIEVHYTNVKT